jgi:hypothetical protein
MTFDLTKGTFATAVNCGIVLLLSGALVHFFTFNVAAQPDGANQVFSASGFSYVADEVQFYIASEFGPSGSTTPGDALIRSGEIGGLGLPPC